MSTIFSYSGVSVSLFGNNARMSFEGLEAFSGPNDLCTKCKPLARCRKLTFFYIQARVFMWENVALNYAGNVSL